MAGLAHEAHASELRHWLLPPVGGKLYLPIAANGTLAILLGSVLAVAFGLLLERVLFRHFYHRDHLDQVRRRLSDWSEMARELGDLDAFCERVVEAFRAHADEETAERFIQAAPPDQLYLGLERYWRKRAEREAQPA